MRLFAARVAANASHLFRVQGSGFRVQGAGFRVVHGSGFRGAPKLCEEYEAPNLIHLKVDLLDALVRCEERRQCLTPLQGSGFRVQGAGCRVQGAGCSVQS